MQHSTAAKTQEAGYENIPSNTQNLLSEIAHRVADVRELGSYHRVVVSSVLFDASPLEAPDVAQQLQESHASVRQGLDCRIHAL